jgi:hypothetical protein
MIRHTLQNPSIRLVSGGRLFFLGFDEGVSIVVEGIANRVLRLLTIRGGDVFCQDERVAVTLHARMENKRAVLLNMKFW